ncbi:hypothetical protein BJ741DRAFT_336830 [Chytriomyces cf. hyalinus JEL632]|nr:hypothetical protein BJ741DRAFT_336830 [Chytriomyces cf. hyalinus JEL632]
MKKVQVGYGKYQGTWIPKEAGIKLAKRHGVDGALRPMLEFSKNNGDIALSKISFDAGDSSSLLPNAGGVGKTASSSMANPSPAIGSPLLSSNAYLSASNAVNEVSFRPLRPRDTLTTSIPTSPMHSPLPSRRPGSVQPSSSQSCAPSPSIREKVSSPPQNEVPFVPQKKPFGPPRNPRQAVKRRRISHDYHSTEAPA